VTNVAALRPLRPLSIALCLLIWVIFHAGLLAAFLPETLPASMSALDDVVYAEIGWGLLWVLGSAHLRAWVLRAGFRRSQQPFEAHGLAFVEMAFTLPASALLWCLAFARQSSYYWGVHSKELHILLRDHAVVAEAGIIAMSAIVGMWIWGTVNIKGRKAGSLWRGLVAACSQCAIQAALVLSLPLLDGCLRAYD